MQGRSIILFIGFLLILSIVNAVEITPQGLSDNLCPRETGRFTHIIKNDNNLVKEYTINLKGSASSWATVVPSGFILSAGEQKTVFTYITPSQSAEPGTYNLQIEASAADDTKTVSHDVVVKNCYSVSLSALPNSKTSCPNDPIQYSITLTNNGEYSETFRLSLNGNLAPRASLSDNLLVLGKKESKTILLFVNSPVDPSDYVLTLISESESGRVRESLPIFLNVNSCYDFNLKVSGNNTYNLCDRSYVVIPLNLKNSGTTLNSYKINIDGPVWVRVEKNEFVLKDQEARTFNLIFAPNYGSAGDYGIRLTVVPEKGNAKSVTDFGITVRKCHSVDVKFLYDKVDACKGAVNNYEALITNDGEVKKSYRLELEAPSWIVLDEKDRVFTLDPKEQKKVVVKASPIDSVKDQEYDVKLRAVATDDSSVSANDIDELSIDVKDAENCYKPSIETKYTNLVVYYDSSTAVPIEIKNNGVRKAEFSLFLSGNAATFSTLAPSAVSIDPGRSEIVYIYVAPNINVKLGSYDSVVSLNVKNGPLLTTKKFNIEITNVKEKTTQIAQPLKTSLDNGKKPVDEISYWQKFKSFIRKAFVSEEERIQFNNVTSVIKVNNDKSSIGKYKYYILGIVITILVIILLVVIFSSKDKKSSKKIKNKSSEDVEDIKDKVEE